MKNVMVIYGTRPEAVKVAPVIHALSRSTQLAPIVVSTGQHREMLDQVNRWFAITPDLDLRILQPGQSLGGLAGRILERLTPVLADHGPDAVLVQGDTTTVAMAAIAAFYARIPVVHLEAGLRSGDITSPFPEEANRRLTGQVAALHLAPTPAARDNLLREAIAPADVVVTGNTVIDALQWTIARPVQFTDERLRAEAERGRQMVLLTTHRRENWGEPMVRIGEAVAELAGRFPQCLFVFPAHGNPAVRAAIEPSVGGLDNVVIVEPLDYPEFVHAQRWATAILTDSGGVQEEAPSLGTPVLVLRDNTERPEAVEAGTARLIGTDVGRIVAETSALLGRASDTVGSGHPVNPYGDGRAAERSVAAIAELLGVGQRIAPFAG